MKRNLQYTFNYIETCNMCGSSTNTHKILGKRLNQSQGKNPKNKIGITTTIVKCSDCKLIYSNPQPIPFDLQNHYGVHPENYWKQDYFKNEIRQLKTLIDFKKGMKSLDIGAGLGKAMIALSNADFDAYGFEPSQPFFERAISQLNMNPDKLKLASIENINYRFIGTDYFTNITMLEPYHLYEFGLKSFQHHAKKNNYDVAFHEYYVCQTYRPKLAECFLTPYMKWANKGLRLSVWLKKNHIFL